MATTSRPQLVFVDGTFAELAQELADYMQIGDEVKASLEKDQREEALGKIVRASSFLHSAPEKDIVGAYNLLIHLVINESKESKKYLPALCTNLHKPFPSSPHNGPNIALTAFQAIFNLLEPASEVRYHVFGEVLKFCKAQGFWENFKLCLKDLPSWLEKWEVDEDDQRKLYMNIADFAMESGDDEQGYQFLLKSLRSFDADEEEEIKSEEAQKLSVRAVRMSLLSNSRFDFLDLRALPTVQALADSQPVYSQLLDIFTEQDLEDYQDFCEEHEGWIEKEKLDHDRLVLKMRLLTLTSLAANTFSRQLEYDRIAKALQIPKEDVEKWIIDVIRVKLVEGRMNQRTQVFQIHRTTFRVFGEKQWREVQTRADALKASLKRVLGVIETAQADAVAQRQRDQQEIERKLQNININGDGPGGGQRRGGRGGHQQNRPPRNDDDD